MTNLLMRLQDLRLPFAKALEIADQVNTYLKLPSQEQAWQAIVDNILSHSRNKSIPFSVHLLLYETVYPDCNRLPCPAWFPTDAIIKNSNINQLMQEVKLTDYQTLYHWSIDSYTEFWELLIKKLNISFETTYNHIIDLSKGIETPEWLPGARLNIANSCFQGKEADIAIVFQKETGQVERITYHELNKLSDKVAVNLQRYLDVGDRVAIIMPMTPQAIAIYLGIIKAGCCVVSIAESFAVNEIETRLNIANTKAVFTQNYIIRDGKKLPLYEKVTEARSPFTIVLPTQKNLNLTLQANDISWETFLQSADEFQTVSCEPHDYTNILFSSGTTGEPKAIPWNHVTPIKCAVDGHLYQNIQPGDIVCWPTSLGWMMGPWLIYATLLNKATIALYEGAPTGVNFGKFIQNNKITILGLVPSHIKNWRLSGCMEGLDWSTIKLFSSSGECSNIEDMLYLMSLAQYKPIIEYCGGTEIAGAYLTSTIIHPSSPAAFSAPALGIDFLILDEKGNETDNGEIALIPPAIGLSTELLNKDHHQIYFADMPCARNHKMLRRHGDQVKRFTNGFYQMQGRIDDTMNLGGVKVSSVEIEALLNHLPDIVETAAVPVSPPGGGPSLLVIYAIVKENNNYTLDKLKETMQNTIKRYLNPLFKIHDIILVNTLPRTASNKLIRKILREQYYEMPFGNSK